jgi:predicted ester cyclase
MMDPLEVARQSNDQFNNQTFYDDAKDIIDPNVVVIDEPMGMEMHGLDAFIQYSDGFVTAMPDIKGTVVDEHVSGDTATLVIRAKGTFTGEMHTPDGSVIPGNGNRLDLEYEAQHQVKNGKIVRFVANYDMQEFMRQLGLA